jgi:hypothetical protein
MKAENYKIWHKSGATLSLTAASRTLPQLGTGERSHSTDNGDEPGHKYERYAEAFTQLPGGMAGVLWSH